jgi:hypothetical protein
VIQVAYGSDSPAGSGLAKWFWGGVERQREREHREMREDRQVARRYSPQEKTAFPHLLVVCFRAGSSRGPGLCKEWTSRTLDRRPAPVFPDTVTHPLEDFAAEELTHSSPLPCLVGEVLGRDKGVLGNTIAVTAAVPAVAIIIVDDSNKLSTQDKIQKIGERN